MSSKTNLKRRCVYHEIERIGETTEGNFSQGFIGVNPGQPAVSPEKWTVKIHEYLPVS